LRIAAIAGQYHRQEPWSARDGKGRQKQIRRRSCRWNRAGIDESDASVLFPRRPLIDAVFTIAAPRGRCASAALVTWKKLSTFTAKVRRH
jgi:hypothetical protein